MTTAESRLAKTFFIVEANTFEQLAPWKEKAKESKDHLNNPLEWKQLNDGWLVTVGEVNNKPCCISTSWARIEGCLVMFYYPTSKMVDWDLIESWISDNFQGKWDNGTRAAKTDARNFHHCVRAIREKNELDGRK